MLVYDRAYTEIKNKYLVPLTDYSVPYTHLKNTNVKSFILTKSKSIDVRNGNEFIFHFEQSDLFKGILGDIELFYIRQIIQNNDSRLVSKSNLSANWNIVTNYYNAFFSASLFLRLCHRGNIFLDNELKKSIERLISNVTGNVVKLDSNQFYEVIEENSEYVLKLQPMNSDGTHEIVWKKMDLLVDELRMLTRKSSDEAFLLTSIKEINNKLVNTYPSKLRNRVNYQPMYGLQYVDKKLFSINENISWLNQLLHFENTDDDNQIACYMYAYTKYIEQFCINLIAEYYDIKGKENGILRKINNNRSDKIGNLELKYSY